jgi:hypothetical protein
MEKASALKLNLWPPQHRLDLSHPNLRFRRVKVLIYLGGQIEQQDHQGA